jgi:hypothetical protein
VNRPSRPAAHAVDVAAAQDVHTGPSRSVLQPERGA